MKKSLICLIVSAATLISLLVLPIFGSGDESVNLVKKISEESFEALYSNMCTFALLLALFVSIAAAVSALLADRKAILISSFAGIGLMLSSYLSSIDASALTFGIAFWIAAAGFLVNTVIAIIFEKKWN